MGLRGRATRKAGSGDPSNLIQLGLAEGWCRQHS